MLRPEELRVLRQSNVHKTFYRGRVAVWLCGDCGCSRYEARGGVCWGFGCRGGANGGRKGCGMERRELDAVTIDFAYVFTDQHSSPLRESRVPSPRYSRTSATLAAGMWYAAPHTFSVDSCCFPREPQFNHRRQFHAPSNYGNIHGPSVFPNARDR